jgi:hypothetical protein
MAYTVPEYKRPSSVEQLNSFPRLAGSSQLTSIDKIDSDYATGLVGILVGFIAAGVLCFLCLPLYWCCRKKTRGANQKARIGFLVCVLVMMIGGFIGYAGNNKINDGMTTFGGGFRDISLLFVDAGKYAGPTGAQGAVDQVSQGNDKMKVACGGADPNHVSGTNLTEDARQDAMKGVDEVHASFKTALDESKTAFKSVVDAVDPIGKETASIEDQLLKWEDSRKSFTMFALIAATGVFVVGLIHIAFVMRGKSAVCPIYYFVMLFGWIIVLFSWILAGVHFMIGVFFADICMDPVNLLASSAGSDKQLEDEIRDLFTCAVAETQTKKTINDTKVALAKVKPQLTELNNATQTSYSAGGCTQDPASAIATMGTGVDSITKALDDTLALLQCPRTNPIMTSVVYDAFCTDIPTGCQYMGASFFLSGFFGLFALCFIGKGDEVNEEESPEMLDATEMEMGTGEKEQY